MINSTGHIDTQPHYIQLLHVTTSYDVDSLNPPPPVIKVGLFVTDDTAATIFKKSDTPKEGTIAIKLGRKQFT